MSFINTRTRIQRHKQSPRRLRTKRHITRNRITLHIPVRNKTNRQTPKNNARSANIAPKPRLKRHPPMQSPRIKHVEKRATNKTVLCHKTLFLRPTKKLQCQTMSSYHSRINELHASYNEIIVFIQYVVYKKSKVYGF